MPLRKLPVTGNWVDPACIARIVLLAGSKNEITEHLPRVIVHFHDGGCEVIECEAGDEQALKLRDEIASMTN